MSEQNREFAYRWFDEVWNKGREDAIEELCNPDVIVHGFPQAGSDTDREGFKEGFRTFHSAFSGFRVSVDDVLAEGDKLAVRWTARMDHTGDGFGFPATGVPVAIEGMSFMRLRNGRVAEGWNSYDLTRVTQQLQSLAAQSA